MATGQTRRHGHRSRSVRGRARRDRCRHRLASKASATNADCAKRCIERDNAAVFVNEADKSVIAIHNVDAIKGHEGHHVKVTGSIMEDKSMHVDKVEMVDDKAGK